MFANEHLRNKLDCFSPMKSTTMALERGGGGGVIVPVIYFIKIKKSIKQNAYIDLYVLNYTQKVISMIACDSWEVCKSNELQLRQSSWKTLIFKCFNGFYFKFCDFFKMLFTTSL